MSDSHSSNPIEVPAKQLHLLLSAAVDGVLSDDQQRQLAKLLHSSPQLRREYVSRVANEALLEERLAKPLLEDMMSDAVSQAAASPERLRSEQSPAGTPQKSNALSSQESRVEVASQNNQAIAKRQTNESHLPQRTVATPQAISTTPQPLTDWMTRHLSLWKVASVAALLVVGVFLIQAIRSSRVGVITSLENVVWATDSQLDIGAGIENKWIEIESGLVRLELPDAQIALYGPAKFRTSGPQDTELSHGNLTARVGPAAAGLIVQTPTSTVTDLGTSFSVSAEPDSTWVHVTEGRVRVKSRSHGESVIGSAGDLISDVAGDSQQPSLTHYQGRMLEPKVSPDWQFVSEHPIDLDRNGFDQNGTAFLFLESSSRVLSSDLKVNLQAAGRYRKFSREGGVVPAGTRVNCYLLHCDPENAEHTVRGQVEFDREILGVISDHDRLNETNAALGASWTLQCQDIHRGLESYPEQNSDVVTISSDRKRLSATLSTRAIDQIRILVSAK